MLDSKKKLKMKKVFLLLSACAGTLFVSCDDSLIEPFAPGALTETVAIQTSNDLQGLMNSTYANLYNREDAVFTSVFTDEAGIGFANGGQGITEEYVFFLNSTSAAPNAVWNSMYFALSRANRVITFADRITPVDAADTERIQRIKAEALVVRAFCHLKLMSYFSTDLKNDGALAAILADRIIPSTETNLQRTTNGVFYQSIHSDLDAALTIFNALTTNPYTGIVRTYYASDVLAKALKARAYAYKGDYTNAETWADNVISTSGITLANTTQYTQIFWTDNEPANVEVIWRLKRTPAQNGQGVNMHNGWCSVRPNAAGSPFYEVGRSLFNIMNPTNIPSATSPANGGWPLTGAIKDVRFRALVAPSSVVAGVPGTYSATAGTYTITTPENHGLQNGDSVVVTFTPTSGAAVTVNTTVSSATLTSFVVSTGTASSTGTCQIWSKLTSQWNNLYTSGAGDYINADKLIIHKYGGVGTGTSTFASTAANGNSNDYKLVRLSEMYFIKAEARANANDLTGAAAALEAVLDARNAVDMPAPVFANATQAWAEILNQRRLEFCFEGYRYIDLKRLASLANFTALDRHPVDYSSSTTNYPGANPANLPMNSYKFTFPIPISETNANTAITQNPGY